MEPKTNIKEMLAEEGYPFKSKRHSETLDRYQRAGRVGKWVKVYLKELSTSSGKFINGDHACPKILRYQFEPGFNLRVSDKCCQRLKEDPLNEWQKENKKKIAIIGLMRAEGGRRESANCLAFRDNKFKAFQPLVPITKEWEEWYIKRNGIELCELYSAPYNFTRTGCKGCPFNINIQRELDTLDKFFPEERKQCEIIWKPVYEEYRRIGYRKMRPLDQGRQMTMDEFMDEEDRKKMAGGNDNDDD